MNEAAITTASPVLNYYFTVPISHGTLLPSDVNTGRIIKVKE